ncbi:tRNA epoxyqueuosine(34) reductase QueG, partial [Acinetobacter johnsonii]
TATIPDFDPRHSLDNISLLDIWQWDEATFLANTEGSPIRRTGYQSFKRNIAIGLGNAPYSNEIVAKLQEAKPWHDEIV